MHSIDALFSAVVDGDDDARAAAIQQIRTSPSAEVFDRAASWCASEDAPRRAAGAEILGQLPELASRAVPILESLTGDEDADVVAAAVLALAQRHDSIDPIVPLAAHPAGKVRWALVSALESFAGDEIAERLLLGLMSDTDVDVRDRATFAIGSLSDTDTPRVRSALFARLGDENPSVAREAALGLARRRDARAIPYIATAVESSDEEIEEAVDEITVPEMLPELMKAKRDPGAPPGVDSLIRLCRARL